MDKKLPASNQFNPVIVYLIIYLITGIFLTPTCLFADEVITTYDKKTIWHPSMFVGRIWARSGDAPTPVVEGNEGRISTGAKEKSSTNLKAGPNSEIKKKLKQKRLKTIQALEKEKAQKTVSNQSSPPPALNIENQKTSEGKTMLPIKTASSKAAGFVSPRARQSGRNWHHKQELYDVECGQKLARVVATYYFDKEEKILSSNVYPDPQWYHIYPRSLEEKLYVEVCHPSNHSR